MQRACVERGLYPGLSPGCGYLHGPGKRYLKDRLMRYDFCRSRLVPAETRTEAEAAAFRRANRAGGGGGGSSKKRRREASSSSEEEQETAKVLEERRRQREAAEQRDPAEDDDGNKGWPANMTAFVGAVSGSGKTPRGFPTPLEALPPDLPSGGVNKLSVGGTMHNQHQTGMLLPNMSKDMPSAAEFATWDRPSQEASGASASPTTPTGCGSPTRSAVPARQLGPAATSPTSWTGCCATSAARRASRPPTRRRTPR